MIFGPQRRRLGPAVVVTLTVVLGFVGTAAGQDSRIAIEEGSVDSLRRHLTSFSPRSGPPGTIVTLRAEHLPILASLRIGVGALRVGFEEVGWILSDAKGEFTFKVEIPAWASHDVAHVFIVFDPYFNPIALSDVFHVTGPDGTLSREGRVTDDERGCLTLTGADRVPYALVGNVTGLEPGAEAVVEGTLAERSACGERTTIAVARTLPGR